MGKSLFKVIIAITVVISGNSSFSQQTYAKRVCDQQTSDLFSLNLQILNGQGCCSETNPDDCVEMDSFSGDCTQSWSEVLKSDKIADSCKCKNTKKIFNFFVENKGQCYSDVESIRKVNITGAKGQKKTVQATSDSLKTEINQNLLEKEYDKISVTTKYFCHVESMYPKALASDYASSDCIKPTPDGSSVVSYLNDLKCPASVPSNLSSAKKAKLVALSSAFVDSGVLAVPNVPLILQSASSFKPKPYNPNFGAINGPTLSGGFFEYNEQYMLKDCNSFSNEVKRGSEEDDSLSCFSNQEFVNMRNVPSQAELNEMYNILDSVKSFDDLKVLSKGVLKSIEDGSTEPKILNLKQLMAKKPFIFDLFAGAASEDKETSELVNKNFDDRLKTMKDYIKFSNETLFVLNQNDLNYKDRGQKLKEYTEKEQSLWLTLKEGVLADTKKQRDLACSATKENLKDLICSYGPSNDEIAQFAKELDSANLAPEDYYSKSNYICEEYGRSQSKVRGVEFGGAMEKILESWNGMDDPAGKYWNKLRNGRNETNPVTKALASVCAKVNKNCASIILNFQECRNNEIAKILDKRESNLKLKNNGMPSELYNNIVPSEDKLFANMDPELVNFLSSIGQLDIGANATAQRDPALDKPAEVKQVSASVEAPQVVARETSVSSSQELVQTASPGVISEFSSGEVKTSNQSNEYRPVQAAFNRPVPSSPTVAKSASPSVESTESDLVKKNIELTNKISALSKKVSELDKAPQTPATSQSLKATNEELQKALADKAKLEKNLEFIKRKNIAKKKAQEEQEDEEDDESTKTSNGRSGVNLGGIQGGQAIPPTVETSQGVSASPSQGPTSSPGQNLGNGADTAGAPGAQSLTKVTPPSTAAQKSAADSANLTLSLVSDNAKLLSLKTVGVEIEAIDQLGGADLSAEQLNKFLEKINVPKGEKNFIVIDPNTKAKYVVSVVDENGRFRLNKVPYDDVEKKLSTPSSSPEKIKNSPRQGDSALKKLNEDLLKVK